MNQEDNEKAMLFYLIHDAPYEMYEEDFNSDINKKIVKKINELRKDKKEVNEQVLSDCLEKEIPDAMTYLFGLVDYSIGRTAETTYNLMIQATKRKKLRMLMLQGQEKLAKGDDTSEVERNIVEEIKKIDSREIHEKTFLEQLSSAIHQMEENYNHRRDYSLYTGFFSLDNMICGLHGGELTILGARPAVGKTTLALQIALNIAKRGKKVAFISLEMSDTQLIFKIISQISQVKLYDMRRGLLQEEHWKKIGEASTQIQNLPLKIISNTNSLSDIVNIVRRMKNQDNLDFLVIDYLQLIRNSGKYNSREQEVADISRTLKLLTLELNIPIMALCQLNRASLQNKGKEPTLADLRESGSIEQDADNVFLLYRLEKEGEADSYYDDICLKVAKQRAGETGEIVLRFFKQVNMFGNLEN